MKDVWAASVYVNKIQISETIMNRNNIGKWHLIPLPGHTMAEYNHGVITRCYGAEWAFIADWNGVEDLGMSKDVTSSCSGIELETMGKPEGGDEFTRAKMNDAWKRNALFTAVTDGNNSFAFSIPANIISGWFMWAARLKEWTGQELTYTLPPNTLNSDFKICSSPIVSHIFTKKMQGGEIRDCK